MRPPCSLHAGSRLARGAVGGMLLVLTLSAGCSSGANVTLQGMFSQTDPAANNGDGSSDNWTDYRQTPTGFAMGIQSAKLTGSDGSSFTLFDEGVNGNNIPDALFTRLYNSPTKVVIDSESDIKNGTYDTLELTLVYYETEVDAYQDTVLHPRRLRTYLQDYNETLIGGKAVTAYDMLIGNGMPTDFTVPTSGNPSDVGSTGTDLTWINPANGNRCAQRSACVNGGNPYQVPSTVFPNPTVKIDLGGQNIVVDSNTDANFIITLTAQIQNLFFYDETDTISPYTTIFNYLSSLPTTSPPNSSESYDGKIQDACSPSDCSGGSTNKLQADFWMGPPQFDVTVTSQ
jgi:hypothetical protein